MSLKSKTILVMDDDRDMLKLLEKVLSGAGLTVLLAENPSQARKLLESSAPHVILTDLTMEGEDGFMFILSVRQQKRFDAIPILALSALNDFKSVKHAISLGVNDYVIKPLQTPMLLRKLRKALSNKDFVKWDASKEKINLDLVFKATIPSLGETGYQLLAPVKASSIKGIGIEVAEFSELGIDGFPQDLNLKINSFASAGSFVNDLSFVAITEAAAQKIRLFIKRNLQT